MNINVPERKEKIMSKELKPDEYAWLQKLEKNIDIVWDDLTHFEQKFIVDLLERFRRYGKRPSLPQSNGASLPRYPIK